MRPDDCIPGQPKYDLELTPREYAAIHLRVPNSETEWLDAMIRESLRIEIAAAAVQGILAKDEARAIADALLGELDKGLAK